MRIGAGSGRIVWNAADPLLQQTLAMGCWTPLEGFARAARRGALWTRARRRADFSSFEVLEGGALRGTVEWSLIGAHNMENALAAIAAARHAGVRCAAAIEALARLQGHRAAHAAARRGRAACASTMTSRITRPRSPPRIDGLRRRIGAARIIAVLEPRSHTMRMGVHRDTLAPSLAGADQVWLYAPADLGWDVSAVARRARRPRPRQRRVDALARRSAAAARAPAIMC